MKTAAEAHLNLEGLDADDTCRLMGHAHEEVLGVAAMAELFNPTHFEVGPSGTIGLTESGLMAVADSKVARGDNPEALQNWTRRKCALILKSQRYEPRTEEMKTAVMRALYALYSQHESGRPSPATRLRVANTLPGRPRLEIAQYLVGIAEYYLKMVVFSDGILKDARPRPVEDALQLAQSLVQQKLLSIDIQRLLGAHDDEL
ncbi:hypothetical protein NCS56_00159800 [Fusarium sp. Ph1]|nr:hypothetical protein NCS56_00159800 [Fusarium sp. Ph1]